ncbi:MAG: hypothetical protein IT320_19365 [Anaerolineae bacterium]|nr:hypothetical protein [Anaerolineae bacterium]
MNDASRGQQNRGRGRRGRLPTYLLILALLVSWALSGCAIGEITGVEPTSTPVPMFEIPPPPEQVYAGECSLYNRNQEFWIQTAAGQTTSFGTLLTRALEEADTRRETLDQLRRLRDDAHSNPTPDCAVPIQLMLTSAMDRAVESLRMSLVDPRINISGTAALVQEMLTQVEHQLKTMTDELELQLQTRAAS